MKKTFTLILALCMLFSLMAGCGDSAASTAETASASVSAAEEASAPAEEAPAAEEPAEEPAEASAEAPAEEPAAEAAPSLTYPMVTDGSQTVTMWVSLPPHVSPYM